MSVDATLKDEQGFRREAFVLIVGGLTSGIAASGLQLIVGESVDALTTLSFGAIIGLFANLVDSRKETAIIRLVLAILGGAAMAAFTSLPLVGAYMGGMLIGAAMTFDRNEALWQRALMWGGYGLALAAALFTSATLFEVGPLKALDVPFFDHAIAGTIWGMFLSVAAGVKDFEWRRDSLLGGLKDALGRADDQNREFLESGIDIYQKVRRECENTKQEDVRRRALDITRETTEALTRFANRFAELRAAESSKEQQRIRGRVDRLEKRIASTEDDKMRKELISMREELEEQLRMRSRLELACMRLETHQQRCLTTLEKLHVTLVQNSTAPSDDVGLNESLSELERLADEVQLKNLSVDELCEDIDEGNETTGDAEDSSERDAVESGDQGAEGDGIVLEESERVLDLDDSADAESELGHDGSLDEEDEPRNSSDGSETEVSEEEVRDDAESEQPEEETVVHE